jgi:hypothetical protein
MQEKRSHMPKVGAFLCLGIGPDPTPHGGGFAADLKVTAFKMLSACLLAVLKGIFIF